MFGIICKINDGKEALYNSAPFRSHDAASCEADILNEMYPENKYSVIDLWAATTNKRSSGGKKSLHAQIHRLMRACGVVYYIALFGEGMDHNAYGQWGMVYEKEIHKLGEAEHIVTGYTRNNCFHRLGRGCANRGAEIYWSW
jgi:hypothetical protein